MKFNFFESKKKAPEEEDKNDASSGKMGKVATVAVGAVMAATAFNADAQTPRTPANPAHQRTHAPAKEKELPSYKAVHQYPNVDRESSDGTGVGEKESETFTGDEGTLTFMGKEGAKDTVRKIGVELEENTGNPQQFVENNTNRFYEWLKDKEVLGMLTEDEWMEEQAKWNTVKSVMLEAASYVRGGGGSISKPRHFDEVDGKMKGHGTNIHEYALYETQFAYDLDVELDGLVKELTYNPNDVHFLRSYMEKAKNQFSEFYRAHPNGLPRQEALYINAMTNDIMLKVKMLSQRGAADLDDFQSGPGMNIEAFNKAIKYSPPREGR